MQTYSFCSIQAVSEDSECRSLRGWMVNLENCCIYWMCFISDISMLATMSKTRFRTAKSYRHLISKRAAMPDSMASTDQIKCSPKCINTNGGKLFTYNRIIGMYAFNQTSTSTVTLSYVPLVVLWGSEWYPIVFSDVYCMLHGFKEWCVPDYIQPSHTGLSPGLRASHIMMWENLSDNSCSLSLFVKGKVE